MILKAGLWMGRGSFRPTTESLGTVFKANIQVSDDVAAGGLLVEATLAVEGSGEHSITAWIVADEYGTYAVAVRGMGLDAQGTAKLESEPHLGLLWSENGDAHVAFTLFVSHESHGLRGFAKTDTTTWTWELALQPAHGGEAKRSPERPRSRKRLANVVSLASRRRK